MKAVFDAAVLIDHLNAVEKASEAIRQYDGAVSSATVIDLLSRAKTVEAQNHARDLLSLFEVVHSNDDIAEQTVSLRREKKLSPQNAVVYATAKHLNCLLVTSNSRDFSDSWGDVKIPYKA